MVCQFVLFIRRLDDNNELNQIPFVYAERKEKRKLYDQTRRDTIPKHGIRAYK